MSIRKSEYAEVDIDEVVTETPMAILVKIDKEEKWIPRSMIDTEHSDLITPKNKVVWIKRWFAEKEELV